MTLYEINAELEKLIANSIDPETGELMIDPEQIDALNMARDEKIEQTALYIKNLKAEADAIKTEIDNLKARHDAAKNKAERLTAYIKDLLAGEKFQTAKVAISYRSTASVEINPDVFFARAANGKYFRVKDPEADKKAIAAAIKAGETIEGAELVSKTSMTIK